MVGTVLQTAAASAVPTAGRDLPGLPSAEKPVKGADIRTGEPRTVAKGPRTPKGKPRAAWPKEGEAVITVTRAATVKQSARSTRSNAQSDVDARVLGHAAAERAGVNGVVLTLEARTSQGNRPGTVDASLDYSSFTEAFGGNYGSRLTLVELPACALDKPDKAECRTATPVETVNDTERHTLTAPDLALRQSGPTVLAAVAAETAGKGDYTATPLSPSATWDTNLNTGDFTWSYDIPVPDVPGGLTPDLGLSYSSGSIDGRTSNTNNQASWVGDGFDLWSGFIERRYKPCYDDGVKNADGNKPGDLCWGYDNAFIAFNGKGGELVPDGDDKFRFKQDDGSRIERLRSTDRGNGDNDGEYWRLTDPDGVRYYFGYNRLPGWTDGKETTNSTWTVPVFGNDSGEPCHKTAFADSWCQQAWRWNLDYVEDPHGNAVAYYYKQEKNSYGRNLVAKNNTPYVRGGSLDRIEYGLKSGSVYGTKPLAKVGFTTSERCLPDTRTDCSDIGKDAFYWYDTPWDLNCDSGKDCDKGRLSPVFFTRKRLTGITTEVLKGDTHTKVDSWTMGHRWGMADTDYQLLLDSIQHTGHTATPAVTLPKTTFAYTQLANRLDRTGDGYAPFIKARLSTVADEYGGQVDVNYSAPACSWDALPTPEKNTTRCFPQFIGGDSQDDPERQWFNKYVVTSTTTTDRTGGAPDGVTQYEYLGGAAWHHDDDDGLTKQKHKTWSQWRGYGQVRVTSGGQGGASAMKTQQDSYFLRGMDGDRESTSGGTKKVSVPLGSGEGDPITDHESAAGFAYRTVTYSGVGGKVLSKTVSRPWHHETARKVRDWGTVTANLTGTARTASWTSLDDGAGNSWATTASESTHDSVAGRVTQVDDLGDTTTAADDRCTRTTYAPGGILTLVARQETVIGACARTPDRAKDVVSDVRTAYDGGEYGDAATKGDATASATLKSHDGTKATYLESNATFDSDGRQLTTTELTADVTVTGTGKPVRTARKDGRTTTTAYSPATGFPTKVTETTPPATAGVASTAQSTVTEFEALRGRPSAQVDPNGNRSEFTYDALGRSSRIWLADRRTSQTPSYEFTYFIDENKPAAIRTQTLDNNGGQRASYVIYDGFLRERQTQEPGPDGGRVLTDVFYDERGLTAKTFAPYYNDEAAPNRALFGPDDALSVETQTRLTHDGLGRETEIRDIAGNGDGGAVLGITRKIYGGDRTTVIPPEGGTATTVIADVRGLVTELRQHHARSADAAFDTTRYTYTPKGELEKVTDPAGNTWRYGYDQLGRETSVDDPDRGTTIRTYDDRGLLTTTKDARGTVLAHVYDGLDRQTELREGSGTGTLRSKWTYDTVSGAKGLLAEATRYVGGAAYTTKVTQYDRLYRPVRTSVVIPGQEGGLQGTYQTGTSYLPSGLIGGVSYSAAGSLPGGSHSLTYEPETLRPISLLGDGFKAETGYSKTGKPLQYTMYGTAAGAKRVQVTNTYEWGTQRLATSRVDRQDVAGVDRYHTYRYDQAGNVLSVSDTSRSGTDTQCFSHDYLQRLTEAWTQGDKTCAAAPSGGVLGGPAPYWQSYAYDKTGNRLAETLHDPSGASGKDTRRTYGYPAPGSAQPHALTSVTTQHPDGTSAEESYGYDAIGNTTTRGAQKLDWDAEGHLAKVVEPAADGTEKVTEYLYDADGNRLIGRTGSTTTLYLGDTEVTLAQGAAKGKATRYTSLGGGHQAVKSDDGTITFVLADHQGTGQLAVDAATQGLTQRRTLPFGGIRGAAPGSWAGTRGFVGGTDDTSGTGLTHLGAREYDPTTGRFLSVDPVMDLTDPQQLNGYAYAENSPVTFSDSTGQWKWLDNVIKKGKQAASGFKNGVVDGYYDLAEGFYSFTDTMGWTQGSAQKIKNDRAGKGLVSVYKTVRGPDQSGSWYKVGYWVGKFVTPFIPGAGGAGAGARAASKPGTVAKIARGVLSKLFSGAVKKAERPRAAPKITFVPDVSTRGIGGKSMPALEIQKAPAGWTHADRMQEASSQVADFALKNYSRKKRLKTYAGGYNIETGDIALAQSGGCKPGPSYCAEGNVVRALGGDPTKVRFTIAYTVESKPDKSLVAVVKPVCWECQLDYPSPFQFELGAVPEPGGIWEKQHF
ncbi:RHS repeat-associated core domain-containing protein [Streptomyces sp. 6-11-2]|uniref:RHS repeat-associated core domain-containing protein n=1 Tax=Streptomyces sp. 6-11-2 TaxID=2585753 RepID=UPI00114437A7|nr:RHS repeat-associated core domain-containing protein [Streptomyces sp. 6-11-2]